jgi:hypothetical protein
MIRALLKHDCLVINNISQINSGNILSVQLGTIGTTRKCRSHAARKLANGIRIEGGVLTVSMD